MVLLISITAEFRGSIETSIPQILNLLQASDSEVREESAEMVLKLSEQGT